jgi:hypothetical protein
VQCTTGTDRCALSRCGHLYCWGCLYTWLCRQRTCPTCKDYCDEVCSLHLELQPVSAYQKLIHPTLDVQDRVIPVYCRDAASENSQLMNASIPPRPAALRLLMPSPASRSSPERAFGTTMNSNTAGMFSAVPAARNRFRVRFSPQQAVVLKQLLFFVGSIVILLLLLW